MMRNVIQSTLIKSRHFSIAVRDKWVGNDGTGAAGVDAVGSTRVTPWEDECKLG
jgi:hypothetical protein